MISTSSRRLSRMDQALSGDVLLSTVLELFPSPALAGELVEAPSRVAPETKPAGPRLSLRAAVRSPEVIAIVAVVVLTACAVTGSLLGNRIVVLAGLGAAILLGIGCHFAIRRLDTPSLSER